MGAQRDGIIPAMHTESRASGPDKEITPLPRRIQTIGRCVMLSKGCVLLCRDLKGGYSYLPGGHVEPGETAFQAIQRELQEEVGTEVRDGTIVMIAEHLYRQRGKPKHEINLVFHVEHSLDALREVASLESHIEFWWAELASLPEIDLRPEFMRAWLLTDHSAPLTKHLPLWLSVSDTA